MKQNRYILAVCMPCNECRPFRGNGYDASQANAYADVHNQREHADEINPDLKMTTRNATPIEAFLIARTD